MAGDSGRDVRLDRNRTGETWGARLGLSGMAEASGPVFRSPPFPEAKGVRSGASDSGPQAEGDRSRSPERNRGGTELARSGVRSARKRSQWLLFSGERAAAQGSCNNRQTRPTIPAGRVSVATESRGRAWRQPWLSREAETADPFRSHERRLRRLAGGSAENEGPADRVRGCRRLPLRGSVSFRERSCPGRRAETTRKPAG